MVYKAQAANGYSPARPRRMKRQATASDDGVVTETPASSSDAPASSSDIPVSTPAPTSDAPATTTERPTTSSEAANTSSNPPPTSETSAPVSSTDAPITTTPISSSPASSTRTPIVTTTSAGPVTTPTSNPPITTNPGTTSNPASQTAPVTTQSSVEVTATQIVPTTAPTTAVFTSVQQTTRVITSGGSTQAVVSDISTAVITSTGLVTTQAVALVTSQSIIPSAQTSVGSILLSTTMTDASGSATVVIPSLFTTTYTSTSDGMAITVTQVVAQPTTLNSDGGGSTSPFFKNKGAVAGVFIVVGIAGAAIILFGLFNYLRTRKRKRLTREAAAAAAISSGRTPFMDDDDDGPPTSGHSGGQSQSEMGYHSASDSRPLYGSYGGATSPTNQFYSNPPGGQSFGTSPPGSINNHGPPMTSYGAPVTNPYGAPGAPNISPNTPLLGGAGAPTSPPNVYSNTNLPKGFEYDYSNHVPPSAADGNFAPVSPSTPTSPTFNKRISLPPPPPGAASPNYGALAAAAGLGGPTMAYGPSSPKPPSSVPPGAYLQSPVVADPRSRRVSNAPSFATTGSQYSVDAPAGSPPRGGLNLPPTYVAMPAVAERGSQNGHSINASDSTGSHSLGAPITPAFGGEDKDQLIRSSSAMSAWDARPQSPGVDQRLDPDTILNVRGKRSPNGRLADPYGSSASEESLGSGSLRDDEDYSRRVLQVANPS